MDNADTKSRQSLLSESSRDKRIALLLVTNVAIGAMVGWSAGRLIPSKSHLPAAAIAAAATGALSYVDIVQKRGQFDTRFAQSVV